MKYLLVFLFCIALSVSSHAKPKAPKFNLKSVSGETVHLKNYKGKVVLINFWATWCSPCRRQMPFLNKLSQKYKAQGLVVLGLAVDDKRKKVDRFLGKNNIDFPVLLDKKGKVSGAFQNLTMPSSVLIDKNGEVVAIFPILYSQGKNELRTKIESQLAL